MSSKRLLANHAAWEFGVSADSFKAPMQVQLSKDPGDIPSPVSGDTSSLDYGSDFFLRIGLAMGGLHSGSSAEPGGKGFLMIFHLALQAFKS